MEILIIGYFSKGIINLFYLLNLNCIVVNKMIVILIWELFVLLVGDGIIWGYNINYIDFRYREFYLYKIKDVFIVIVVIDNLEFVIMYYF